MRLNTEVTGQLVNHGRSFPQAGAPKPEPGRGRGT